MTRLRDPKLREAKVKLEEDIRALIETFKKEYDIEAIWINPDESRRNFSLKLCIQGPPINAKLILNSTKQNELPIG